MKYIFEQYKDNPTMTIRVGYFQTNLTNGEAELNPKKEGDKILIDTFGGQPVPEEERPEHKPVKAQTSPLLEKPVKKTTKKEGD